MDELEYYFSHRAIIKVISCLRASLAKKRHDQQFFFNLSTHAPPPCSSESEQDKQLYAMLPPRKKWCRLNLEERRYKNTLEINSLSIERAVLIELNRKNRGKELQPWFIKLDEFIKKIQDVVLNESPYTLESPYIQPIKKDSKKNNHEYRVIAVYNLFDRIIIGQISKYLRAIFDQDFESTSYAFRVRKDDKPCPNHHDAVEDILKYREEFSGNPLWLAECDIQGFFDCVEHEQAREAMRKAQARAEKRGKSVDLRSLRFFDQYLESYSFRETALLKAQEWFDSHNIKGEINKRDQVLANFYPDLSTQKIGIPQGGALSCLIANLILDEADKQVKNYDGLFYARYCDDMIMIHPEQEQCKSAFETYKETLKHLKLPIHEPEKIHEYNATFWQYKSKQPYKWGAKSEDISIPWIGFVGYQIRYDGYLRIRPSSLLKELNKQIWETDKVLKVTCSNVEKEKGSKGIINVTYYEEGVRKTKEQILYRLAKRLIAMSVGNRKFDKSFDAINDYCWCRGFKLLRKYPFIKSQLRRLDRGRKHQLQRAKRLLQYLRIRKEDSQRPKRIIKYFGKPFSYDAQFPNTENVAPSLLDGDKNGND
ncbi:MAG TPA: reverse transcriptase domain-containing protein [Nostocaceae cyanobacterium]|nr:reverse transcriptase domain-containing protein [Nostocaceae cyanobacterium]